jgi:hypothetical protein
MGGGFPHHTGEPGSANWCTYVVFLLVQMSECFKVHASANHAYMQQFISRPSVSKGAVSAASTKVGVAGSAALDGLHVLSA